MSAIPNNLKYTEDHEWVDLSTKGKARIGITDYAQKQLGDIVFVELPKKGQKFTKGDAFGTVESVKSVSDLFAPIPGTVATFNEELESDPELINSDPYGDGWIMELTLDGSAAPTELLTAAQYKAHLSE
ncbi:glycine cleavage system protein GcvH [Kitasatospora sp. NPDC096140]|uniref:glycine cleavage system protein GcvH n=1 Tax=unclassified Kitasatospora TaxID=2633591 RepID=UPI003333A98A